MYYLNEWYPSIVQYMTSGANAGGINVMTYDLSDNPQFHECPEVSGGVKVKGCVRVRLCVCVWRSRGLDFVV